MASHSFCRWLSESDAFSSRWNLRVFGEEPRPAYDRVNLTSYFKTKDAQELELASKDWYAQREIELNTGVSITSIDREQRILLTSNSEQVAYDKLVFATGSVPFVPPISGVDLPGVFVYRTIEDLESIIEWGTNCKTAAVIGGGLLGLEAAQALREMNLIPHVVEMASGLMPRQLDRDCADALRLRVERKGVQVHLTRRTQCIEKHGDYIVIQFDNGDQLAVDMVIISAGIRPRNELAQKADLAIGDRGGIVINEKLQTDDPHIYAIGECAQHGDRVYGLVGPCHQMAMALAKQLNGGNETFERGDQSTRLKLIGVDVHTYGEPLCEATDVSILSAKPKEGVRKLLLRNGRLAGAIAVGEWPESDKIRVAIQEDSKVRPWQEQRFLKTGNLFSQKSVDDPNQWSPNVIVCGCLQVQCRDIIQARDEGCDSVESLAAATGASTACGSCRSLLGQLVGSEVPNVNPTSNIGLMTASIATIGFLALLSACGPFDYSKSVNDFPYAN